PGLRTHHRELELDLLPELAEGIGDQPEVLEIGGNANPHHARVSGPARDLLDGRNRGRDLDYPRTVPTSECRQDGVAGHTSVNCPKRPDQRPPASGRAWISSHRGPPYRPCCLGKPRALHVR